MVWDPTAALLAFSVVASSCALSHDFSQKGDGQPWQGCKMPSMQQLGRIWHSRVDQNSERMLQMEEVLLAWWSLPAHNFKKVHTMILEENIKKYTFMNKQYSP
jgi:hypothetical protein